MRSPLAVAPFAGAWIEIFQLRHLFFDILVAPFAGAWIEMIGFVNARECL